jgi:hypothetical protein
VSRAAPNRFPTQLGREKDKAMKFATVSKSAVLGLALLLASSAFAGTKGTLQLATSATVNGTQLKAGAYKLQWEGSGPNVEVSILQGKNVIAKVSAHVVDLSSAPDYDTAVVKKSGDGVNMLTGVRFGGKKFALELGESSGGMPTGSSE